MHIRRRLSEERLAWISTGGDSPKREADFPIIAYVVRRNASPFHQGTLIGFSSRPEARMMGR